MRKNSGFTLVELVIAIPVILVVMGAVMGFLITMLTDFSNQRAKQNLNVSAQTALSQIEADVKLSSAFLTKISDPDFTDTAAPSGGWTYEGGTPVAEPSASRPYRVLILKTYATDANTLSDTRKPVYLNENGCAGNALYSNPVLSNTVIYFVNGTTLYRRILTDKKTTPAKCSTPFQVQSCPSGCQVEDTIILKNVKEFKANYYADSATSAALANIYGNNPVDDGVLDSAVSVDVSFKHTVDPSSPIINSASLRMTRLN